MSHLVNGGKIRNLLHINTHLNKVPSSLCILKSHGVWEESLDPMTLGICPINEIYNAGTIPHSQRFLAGQIPMVRGSQMDFTLNDHGEMSVFNFRGTVNMSDKDFVYFRTWHIHCLGAKYCEVQWSIWKSSSHAHEDPRTHAERVAYPTIFAYVCNATGCHQANGVLVQFRKAIYQLKVFHLF